MKIIRSSEDLNPKTNEIPPETQNLIVYANTLIIGGKESSIFEENSYTVLYLEDNPVRMECIGIAKAINTDIISTQNSIDGTKMKIRNNTSWTIVSDFNPSSLFENKVVLYTIGKPIDINETNSGIQSVFISRNAVPNKINQEINESFMSSELSIALYEMEEAHNLTKNELIDISLVNNIANSALYFHRKVIDYDTVYDIKLSYDKSFAMAFNEGLSIKGMYNGSYSRIPLATEKLIPSSNGNIYRGTSNLLLAKMTPIAERNGINVINETLDFNMNIPWQYLKNGIGQMDLKTLIANDDNAWKKELYQLLLACLELTRAYSNGFADYQKKDNNGRLGIDPDATIGGVKIGLLGGTNSTDAVPSIDGRIENWKSTHPDKLDTLEFKIFKACILYLSPFIQSSYALGKGLTKANRMYQMFYFQLNTPVSKGLADHVETSLSVTTKSDLFDFNVEVFNENELKTYHYDLFLKEEFRNPLKYKSINVDGYLTFSEIPEKWQAMNRPTKPGDVNLASDDISRYYFYVPFDVRNENIGKFYGEVKSTPTTDFQEKIITIDAETDEVVDTGDNGLSETEWKDLISKKVAQINTSSPTLLYTTYISPYISPSEELQFLGGNPRVEPYRVSPVAFAPNEPTGEYTGPIYISQYETRREIVGGSTASVVVVYKKVKFKFQMRYWSKITSQTLEEISSNALMTKNDFHDIVKENYANDTFNDNYVNIGGNFHIPTISQSGKTLIDRITQISLNGLWGNDFNITIMVANTATAKTDEITISGLEFLSKYNETNTTTRVNL